MAADPKTAIESLRFAFVPSVQLLEHCSIEEGQCLVMDDIDLGGTMFWNASPMEFLKSATDVTKTGSLRILGEVVHIPPCSRIFTTNAKTLREYLKVARWG